MCGFTAIFAPNSGIAPGALERGLASLHHRGPDGQKIWTSSDGHVGLAHARLSIIDLATGEQPIANEDGSIQIIVNGEFYGFEAIRTELEAAGHRFRTKSDSEIAIHLYETYGPQCLKRLRGEFAFVLWDAANRTLFAARDRFGIKPLFFSVVGDTLYIASEIKALFAAGVPAVWDEESIFQLHSGWHFSPSRTLFRGVEQLPPGHFMLATPTQRRVIEYWDFDYPEAGSPSLIKDPVEVLGAFRAKFEEAVRVRLRADVPVGCYLSGGIDSCAILGTANQLSSQPIHAFSLKFEGGYDESGVASEMAAHAKAPFSPISVTARDLADNFEAALWHGERPFTNAHSVAKFLLSRHVRGEGYKVVMTGEGADEILGGYAHFRKDWLFHNSKITDPAERTRFMAEMERSNPTSRGLMMTGGDPIPEVQALLGFVPAFIQAASARQSLRMLRPDLRERFAGWSPCRQLFNEIDVRRQLRDREPVNQSLYLWSKTMLPHYLLSVLGDRMEMAHSIEGRVPFLDHELVELMTRVPVSEKIKGMEGEKHVLREAARPVLTDTVYRRQKQPFLAPPAGAGKDPALRELIHDTLTGAGRVEVGFFDSRAVQALLAEADGATTMEARAALDPALMSVLSFALLQRRFKASSPA